MTATLIPVYPLIMRNEGDWTPEPEMYFTRSFITNLIRMQRVTPDKHNRRDGFRLKRENGQTLMVLDDADIAADYVEEGLAYTPKGRFVWVLDTESDWVEHLDSGELVMKGRWPD